ncbi:MAG TPA: hypothetical protein EYQ46_03185 [Myxococcales bacterium]|nr:hypothetical protein [Myxococcales bacterium]HIL80934.1 hypothetical protein [Myxococcales bacterium]
MLQDTREVFGESALAWNDQPDPAELAALEDIQREGWFDKEEPVVVSLSDLVDAVSSISDTEAEVLATVAHMLESGSVALLGSEQITSAPIH